MLKSILLGFAYAIWGGLGIVLNAIFPFLFSNNRWTFRQLSEFFNSTGVIVMNFFSKFATR
ncbi:SMR family transporter [Chryseobacterium aquaticum]|uniref:SMR family transporter n=1 Tax=Chryseobacterium aquaticum TaxID=452084 RepID=UPI003741FE2A